MWSVLVFFEVLNINHELQFVGKINTKYFKSVS